MKRMFAAVFVFLVLAFPAGVRAEIFGISNVTVIAMDGSEPREGMIVIVEGDRITRVLGPGQQTTEQTFPVDVFIDGTGKFLVPGMAEMHGHIPRATSYSQDLKDLLFLYLANGVTTVRGMLGNDGQLQLRQDILDGKILGPTLYLGGPSFNGNSVSSPLQARRMVRDQVKEGWDFLKIHPGLTMDEYNAMADEATKLGITWGGHVPQDVGLRRALEAGQVTIDHIDGYDIFVNGEITRHDESLLAIAVDMTIDAGAGIVPTEFLWEGILGTHDAAELAAMEELKYITPALRQSYANRYQQRTGERLRRAEANVATRRAVLKALYDGGAVILLGSDAPQLYSVPGFSILREMQTMAEIGIPPEGILQSGSANVGDFFADKDVFGRIAPGNRADLILLDANPLEDIANMGQIAGVMVRGVWLSREDIDTRLAEIEARNEGVAAF